MDPRTTPELSSDTPLVRTCRAVIATQYILLAGHVLVKELQATPDAETKAALLREEWEGWAERLKVFAAADGVEDREGMERAEEWNLERDAKKAGEKVEEWLRSGV